MMVQGRWALVTGASGGLGAEFASLLAERGYNLVLAARSIDRLQAAATQMRSLGIQVHVEQSDLSEPDSPASLISAMKKRGIRLDVLIANAGQGMHGEFVEQSGDAIGRMIRLNVEGLTVLAHDVAVDMAQNGSGHILLIASMTAYMPCPTYAAYAATKAYVRSLGEALHFEMAPRGVTVTVLSPGLMDTGFLSSSGQQASTSMKRAMTSPRRTAEIGLEALFAKKQSVVAGSMNKIGAFASRLMPRGFQTRVAARMLNE